MLKKVTIFIIVISILMFSVVVGLPLITYRYFAKDFVTKEQIINKKDVGVTLFDRNNEPFFTFFNAKSEEYIPLKDIPHSVQEAIISSEDKNFYSNPGFSLQAIIRAFFADISARKIIQGGSTISQELIKNTLLNSNRSFLRKYQEIVLAYELNRHFSKQEILEMYLNTIYFGEGSFGIENAAETYFNVPAKKLNLAQSALLIGLLPAPSSLSPLSNNPSKAEVKQKDVLNNMVKNGFITSQEKEKALREKLFYNKKGNDINTVAPHFALMVRDLLIKRYGEEYVARSGLRVKTTLDLNLQIFAQKTVKEEVKKLNPDHATNGAAVIVDPKTGEILAMVGSIDWYNNEFGKVNMALSPRQVGSSFKPIIYSAAFEDRLITPATILEDKPTVFPGNYKPHDYDGKYRGPVTVRRALANSLNIPAVEVMDKVGVVDGLLMAQRLGITTLNEDSSNYGLSLVLGAGNIRLVDLTEVYAVFANNGKKNSNAAILEIRDKYNNLVSKYTPQQIQVIGDDVSYLITSILSDNNARREEFGNLLTIDRTAAVKTGTTEDFRDALTLGYTPDITIGVWVGNNDNSPMDNVAGSLGAAPIWKILMTHYLADKPDKPFQIPSTIVAKNVCTAKTYTEYFIAGTEPERGCFLPEPNLANQISSNSGLLAEPSPYFPDTPTPTTPLQSTNPPDTPTPISIISGRSIR